MDILVKFGQRLKQLRKVQGISQEKFALKIGIDRTYYSAIEKGKHSISLEKIYVIAAGFNLSIQDLFEGF